MLGFLPGLAYMGDVPPELGIAASGLATPKKSRPMCSESQ
jgi:allophanate hydrolase subunit 1